MLPRRQHSMPDPYNPAAAPCRHREMAFYTSQANPALCRLVGSKEYRGWINLSPEADGGTMPVFPFSRGRDHDRHDFHDRDDAQTSLTPSPTLPVSKTSTTPAPTASWRIQSNAIPFRSFHFLVLPGRMPTYPPLVVFANVD